MIQIQFGEHRYDAGLYDIYEAGQFTGMALFAMNAGQVGLGASVIASDEATAAKLRGLGYRCVTIGKATRPKRCLKREDT